MVHLSTRQLADRLEPFLAQQAKYCGLRLLTPKEMDHVLQDDGTHRYARDGPHALTFVFQTGNGRMVTVVVSDPEE